MKRRLIFASPALVVAGGAFAQSDWKPNRPIRLVVPYGPGGSADQVARIYGERLAATLGQQVIVEDKPGASGGVGAQMVATAPADGHTLLLSPTAIMAITPAVRKVTYNPDDFAAVARLSTPVFTVTITNKLGATNWQEFVALAKQHPGEYWYGSSGLGTITHLSGEVLTRAAGIRMQHSPYKTIVDAVGDVFDGRIQMVFDPSFVPYAKSGKCRVVLTEGASRLPDLPDVPTARELGLDLKSFRERSWFGLFAPKGTPANIVARLSEEIAKAAALPDIKEKLALVAQTAHHQSAPDFGRQVADDKIYFASLIKELDLKLE
ncbi:MAG: tripartite tricarboxylate transporter substrate binding protein [Enhydrobacter sp.]